MYNIIKKIIRSKLNKRIKIITTENFHNTLNNIYFSKVLKVSDMKL